MACLEDIQRKDEGNLGPVAAQSTVSGDKINNCVTCGKELKNEECKILISLAIYEGFNSCLKKVQSQTSDGKKDIIMNVSESHSPLSCPETSEKIKQLDNRDKSPRRTSRTYRSHPANSSPRSMTRRNSIDDGQRKKILKNITFNSNQPTPIDSYLSKGNLIQVKGQPQGNEDGFSKLMWERAAKIQQSESIFDFKMCTAKQIYILLRKVSKHYRCFPVGSSVTGFAVKKSNLDLCIVGRPKQNKQVIHDSSVNVLESLRDLLKEYKDVKNLYLGGEEIIELHFEVETRTSVKDIGDTLKVQIRYGSTFDLETARLLYAYSMLDERVIPFVLIVKEWSMLNSITDPKIGTFESHALTLLAINFLQTGISPRVVNILQVDNPSQFKENTNYYVYPCHFNEDFKTAVSKNTMTLAQLFSQFLIFLNEFNFNKNVVTVRLGCQLEKDHPLVFHNINWGVVAIEEPYNLTNTSAAITDSGLKLIRAVLEKGKKQDQQKYY